MNKLTLSQPRIGIFSDIHLGNYRDDPKWHQIAINMSEWIAEKYRAAGIKDIIIPGDVFHNRFEVSVTTLATAWKFFDNLKDFNIIITIGNHDAFYRDRSDVNSLDVFKEWRNISVVSSPQTITEFDRSITLCPWAMDVAKIPLCDVIIGHFEIAGFQFAPLKICTTGTNSASLLARAPLVISGHFHVAAERKYNGGTIKYVGTPYQLNWAEARDEKFIYIFDLETLKFEAIKNDISPKHIKIKMSEWSAGDVDMSTVAGNIVNMIIDGHHDDPGIDMQDQIVQKFTSDVLHRKPVDYRITYVSAVNTIAQFDKEFDGVDVLSSMREFIDLLNLDEHKKRLVIDKTAELYARNQ